jgi:acyl-CoA oxidase
VLAWATELATEGDTAMGYPVEYGGQDAVARSVAGFETLAYGDLSLLVKCGVQFGLFGGAVLHLGTPKHHERYLYRIAKLQLPGCFAMTETGHGSNGPGAAHDRDIRHAVGGVRRPHARRRRAQGLHRRRRPRRPPRRRLRPAARRRRVAGRPRLVVPIRDDDGNVRPAVRIEDCGAKLGLDGVDNGRIWFDHVRVPRDALLDRYASVTPEGTYASPIKDPTKRFFTMLGTLIQGRVSVCGASIYATKVALDIAIRRGLTRRQFGPPGAPEALLMDYRTHQRRLLPALATTYALHFAQDRLRAHLQEVFAHGANADERRRRELETLAAGLKAVATWHATDTIQACREACGGAGYLKANRFAALKADTDVFTTFEGENTVLLPTTATNSASSTRSAWGSSSPARSSASSPSGPRRAGCSPARRRPDPRPRRRRRPARARDAARSLPLAAEAHPGRRGATAEGRHRRRARPVRGPRRLPGPRRRDRARVGRPRGARGVRRCGRALRRPGPQGRATASAASTR